MKSETKADRTMLPKDRQKVRWQTQQDFDKKIWRYGIFSEGDNLFCEGFENIATFWDLSLDVICWSPINIEWESLGYDKNFMHHHLKGVDDFGNEYTASGHFYNGELLYEPKDIFLVDA